MKYFCRLSRRIYGPRLCGPDGFTIVEVMIVLAIAGLMLLVIFEAIPALERSSRNNQRKQDVQAILAAVSHYELSNSGNMPASGSNFLQYTKLTYYENSVRYNAAPSNGIGVYAYGDATSAPHNVAGNTSTEEVLIYNYQRCKSSGGGSTSYAAGYSDVVALYAVENGKGGGTPLCQQL